MIRGRNHNQPEYGLPCRSIAFGCDHGGFGLKQQIVEYLTSKYPNVTITDCGCFNESRVDYPDLVAAACRLVQDKMVDRAILLDGAGVASGVAANKFNGIRAGVVHDHFSATMARLHTDCNVFCLGGKTMGIELAKEIVDVFVTAKFEGERHLPRLAKVEAIETSQSVNCAADSLAMSSRGVKGGDIASPFKLPL